MSPAHALLRPKYGGTLRLKLPFSFTGLDPHRLDDAISALFAPAVFDTLYAIDAAGNPFPALAEGLPEAESKGARIALRPGLVTALGKKLTSTDVVFALRRSARAGGTAWLSQFGEPRLDPKDRRRVFYTDAEPRALATALASPITAIVPQGFNRLTPDGTGAFLAHPRARGLVLERNDHAARGPAFLDRVDASGAKDLSDALRAFESGEVDIGWLGKGLHQPRAGALGFDAGPLGWVVLHSGAQAGAWGRPGVVQSLLDGLPSDRFRHLGLSVPRGTAAPVWGGPEGALLVDSDSPLLHEIAMLLASLLGRSGHRLNATPRSAAELRQAKRSKQFLLMLEFVRRLGDGPRAATMALYTAADPALARHPPHSGSSPRVVGRSLSMGVVGELHAYGAHLPNLIDLDHWQLGACWLTK